MNDYSFYRLFEKHKKIVLFGICGAITASIEFVTFLVLQQFTDAIYIISVISFAVGLLSSYLLNKYIVFKKSEKSYAEAGQFFALGLINSQISSITTLVLANFMDSVVAKALTIIAIAIWNYTIMNMIIFRKGRPTPARTE